MSARGYFVAGTDTGVGKTLITAALLRTAQAHGLRAGGLKPVAAGCERSAQGLVNDDALVLLEHSGGARLAYGQVNPVALEPAIAPHIAAAEVGLRLSAGELARHVRELGAAGGADVVLVEGAGGWYVPLNERETMADLARLAGWPVVLVVGMRLGCLSHALLTAEAVRGAGLALAGWVANAVDPQMPRLAENIAALDERLDALRLGSVPWLGAHARPETAALYLDATALFGSLT